MWEEAVAAVGRRPDASTLLCAEIIQSGGD
jgi:hypothetical protein